MFATGRTVHVLTNKSTSSKKTAREVDGGMIERQMKWFIVLIFTKWLCGERCVCGAENGLLLDQD